MTTQAGPRDKATGQAKPVAMRNQKREGDGFTPRPPEEAQSFKHLDFDPANLTSALGRSFFVFCFVFSVATTNARQKPPKERFTLAHSLGVSPPWWAVSAAGDSCSC